MAKKPRKKFDTGEGNLEMIKNSVTAIKHHADELTSELKKNPEIEAWVLAKVDRAAQNLSDVTHYLDGEMNKFAKGGKTPIVRTQFEEEEFEYADGGQITTDELEKVGFKYQVIYETSNFDDEHSLRVIYFDSKEKAYNFYKDLIEDDMNDFHNIQMGIFYPLIASKTGGEFDFGLFSKGLQDVATKKMAKGVLLTDYSKISSVEVDGIDTNDAPDFVDAYITYAEYDGEPMTDEQLEELNQDGDFVYSAVERHLYKKGGKVKRKRWIQDALSGDHKGALRETAKRKGLLRGDEKLSKTDLHKLEKMGGKTARRARLAETLRDFKK